MRPIIIALILASSLLAGCADDPEPFVPDPNAGWQPMDPTPEPDPEPEEEPNIAPTAQFTVNGNSLGAPLELTGAQNVSFDGSLSSDPEGESLGYTWVADDEPAGNEATLTLLLAVGEHVITLTVTDPEGASGTAAATVVILPEAEPPAPIVYFFDGAEDDATDWNLTHYVRVDLLGGGGPVPAYVHLTDVPHPNEWHRTSAQALSGENSWTMIFDELGEVEGPQGYGDDAYVSMVSPPIALNGSSAWWSFWIGGDAEPATREGVFYRISADGGATWESIGQISGPVDLFTKYEVDLAEYLGETVLLQLLFTSDASCSAISPIPQGVPEELPMCAGEDGEYLGYYVDDILVTER